MQVIGVKFNGVGKTYYFDPGEFEIKIGDHVIVDTARGPEYALVTMGRRDIGDRKLNSPLKNVLKIADEDDAATNEENKKKKKKPSGSASKRSKRTGWT